MTSNLSKLSFVSIRILPFGKLSNNFVVLLSV